MSLTDGFGRVHTYLRIAVTDRCNLRCVYCMPHDGFISKPRAEILTLEEIERLARLFVGLGIEKIRLTGGEPTVRAGLEWLVTRLAALPELKTLAVTTNGLLLKEQAARLRTAGVQAVNISLDTLRPARFQEITLRDRFIDVLAGIDAARHAGFAPLKLNVVIIKGVNDDQLLDFVEFVRDRPLNIRFIEFMPFRGNRWTKDRFIPWRELQHRISEHYELTSPPVDGPTPQRGVEISTSSEGVRGGEGLGRIPDSLPIAKDFTIPGFMGTVSFISPLSEEFCLGCNRLRLTADGALKSCLLRERRSVCAIHCVPAPPTPNSPR